MRFHGEMRVQGSGPLDGPRFDALAYALAGIEETDPSVADMDLTASLAQGRVVASMVIDAETVDFAVRKLIAVVRVAAAQAGDRDAAHGWHFLVDRAGLSVQPVSAAAGPAPAAADGSEAAHQESTSPAGTRAETASPSRLERGPFVPGRPEGFGAGPGRAEPGRAGPGRAEPGRGDPDRSGPDRGGPGRPVPPQPAPGPQVPVPSAAGPSVAHADTAPQPPFDHAGAAQRPATRAMPGPGSPGPRTPGPGTPGPAQTEGRPQASWRRPPTG